MKVLRISLVVALLINPVMVVGDVPTQAQIKAVWSKNPEVIVAMVQKLYVLEHALPEIEFPSLQIVETNDERVVIGYDGEMLILIGEPPNHLEYVVTLDPENVTIARPVEDETVISPWIFVAGGIVLFFGGVVTGVLSTR